MLATIAALDRGEVRVAEKVGGEWIVHEWVKRAIMLYFRIAGLETWRAGPLEFHDKVPPKQGLADAGVRVVPPGMVRYGAFCEPGVVVMPGYVNIGARVGSRHHGRHLGHRRLLRPDRPRRAPLGRGRASAGVLEPPSARPVIVEDGAFIGSRCILVEGVMSKRGRCSAPTP